MSYTPHLLRRVLTRCDETFPGVPQTHDMPYQQLSSLQILSGPLHTQVLLTDTVQTPIPLLKLRDIRWLFVC